MCFFDTLQVVFKICSDEIRISIDNLHLTVKICLSNDLSFTYCREFQSTLLNAGVVHIQSNLSACGINLIIVTQL